MNCIIFYMQSFAAGDQQVRNICVVIDQTPIHFVYSSNFSKIHLRKTLRNLMCLDIKEFRTKLSILEYFQP